MMTDGHDGHEMVMTEQYRMLTKLVLVIVGDGHHDGHDGRDRDGDGGGIVSLYLLTRVS